MAAFSFRFSRTLVLAGALASGLALAPTLAAQSPIDGTFRYDAAASDDVEAAVDAAIADLNFMHRRFARGHLQDMNVPYRRVRIATSDSTASIKIDGRPPISLRTDGERNRWRGPEGEELTVSMDWTDGALRQTLHEHGAERENLFRLDPGGQTLAMTVTVRMDLLPEPIRYRLVYRREN